MRHLSSLDASAALGLLINLSGKMRMLSHRIAMFIVSGALHPGTNGEDERLHSALDEFRQIHAALRAGNPDWGISAPVVDMISDGDALGPQAHSIIESFVEQTKAQMGGGQEECLTAFVEFVAGPLLNRLNQITNHISGTLEKLHEQQRQRAISSECAVNEALVAIEKVSISVRIIAINAATEAVRAGDFAPRLFDHCQGNPRLERPSRRTGAVGTG